MRWRKILAAVILLSPLACSTKNTDIPTVEFFEQGEFPRQLSAWGVIFRRENELVLNQNVIPYDLNSALFTDYAHKLRTIWIPDGKQITYQPEIDLQLPVGSIVTKTFYYPTENGVLLKTDDYSGDFSSRGLNINTVRLIETRVLIHLEDGWHGLPYVWNSEQSDAILQITGHAQPLTLKDEQATTSFTYIVPDSNQCQACHVDNMTSKEMRLLGIKTRHLDKAYNGIIASNNQLRHWHQLQKLATLPQVTAANVDWQDQNQTLAERASAYMDINCGHCHNPVGPADTSGLFLSNDSVFANNNDPIHLGICKPPVAAGQGTGGRRVGIYPGNAEQSIFTYRLESSDLGAMMPELGRSLVHEEGAALIREWINAMPGDCD